MRHVLSLDPGKTTGWAFFHLHEDRPIELIDSGMIPRGVDGFIKWVEDRYDRAGDHRPPRMIVVSEIFIYDGRTIKPDLTPLKIEGALSVLFPGWIGQRNLAKAAAPDELLKENGLWKKGAGHDRDAIRHAIYYARGVRHLPTIEKFWPPGERLQAE